MYRPPPLLAHCRTIGRLVAFHGLLRRRQRDYGKNLAPPRFNSSLATAFQSLLRLGDEGLPGARTSHVQEVETVLELETRRRPSRPREHRWRLANVCLSLPPPAKAGRLPSRANNRQTTTLPLRSRVSQVWQGGCERWQWSAGAVEWKISPKRIGSRPFLLKTIPNPTAVLFLNGCKSDAHANKSIR